MTIAIKDIKIGTYSGKAKLWGFGTSMGKGTEELIVDLELEIPIPGQEKPDLVTMSKPLFFSDNAIDKTVEQLKILGWDPATTPFAWLLEGKGGLDANEVDVTIEDDWYEQKNKEGGQTKVRTARVGWINRKGGRGLQMSEASPEVKARLSSRVNDAMKRMEMKAKGGNTPGPAAPKARGVGNDNNPANAVDDSDIPF